MRYLSTFVLLFLVSLSVYACTGNFDWTGIKYPCSDTRPCASGFVCNAGFCVSTTAEKTNPDAGVEYDPDSPFRPPMTPKVAMIYVGPVGDFGWTWAHEQGRKYVANLGYETTFAESILPQDAPKQMEDFIKRGYNVIIGTSHDFLVPLLSKTSLHPNVNFLTCSGFETGRNMGSYFGRMYQIQWLAGMVAGATTKTNRVGLLAPVAIPEVIRHINAYTNGVRFINPKATVTVNWIGFWFDVKKEPLLLQEMLDNNVDVIHGHSDTSIPIEMVENKGGDPLTTKDGNKAYTIGFNGINACDFGPRTCLTTAYWNWGPLMARILDQMKKGTWNPSDIIWEQIRSDKNDSTAYLTEISPVVPGPARVQIQSFIPKLVKEGVEAQQLPFPAPQKDNTGKERLPAGKLFTDRDLLNMCWYVEGVVNPDGSPASVPLECKGDR